jgi:UDP-hydrolysing UDP-N-acetyl-D-glucosamine 2-epimerase
MRKICVITGSRSEYGLLYPLLKKIQDDADLELQLVVTGMHLSSEFGLTYQEIEQDGFHIDEKIETVLSSDSAVAIGKSMGLGLIGFSETLARLQPDIVVVLGDRYEILVAAQAAMILSIPIAHIHGGELTEGAVDESIRHAMTKMSHLHFVSTPEYKKRVIQLGEQPERVFHVGAMGIDNILNQDLLDLARFEESINFQLGDINFLVTYHPVTLSNLSSEYLINELFLALEQFPNATVIFTKPNSDADGRIISYKIDEFVAKNIDKRVAYTSLGKLRYLSALQHVDVIIGNSSSGIIEVPVFNIPTVNIGSRQTGRLKGPSIIDCGDEHLEIVQAITTAISESFRNNLLHQTSSIYGDGNATQRIIDVLREVDLTILLRKKFYDL